MRCGMNVQHADDAVSALRIATDEHEAAIKVARGALEAIRALVAELDVARATAESDLVAPRDVVSRRGAGDARRSPSSKWSELERDGQR